MAIFRPTQIAGSIYDIDGETLKRAGIKGIILNWNNTLVKGNFETSDAMKGWLREFKDRYGIKLIIVSNSKPPAQEHDLTNEIPALFKAGKPKKAAFYEAMNILETRTNETAVIGNGMIADIWNGNRLGMYTIFVSPPWSEPRIIGKIKRIVVRMLRI